MDLNNQKMTNDPPSPLQLASMDCLTVTYQARSAHSHTLRIGGIAI